MGDIIMILAPDEHQAAIWDNDLKGNMKPGAALALHMASTSISA
jgi:ketol-acid reductoisomerase